MRVEGSTIMVTGGSSGLGAATVRLLHSRGASVVIADVNPDGESAAVKLGDRALFVRTDVTQEQDALEAVRQAQTHFTTLHGLVNCAGVAPSERIIGKTGPHSIISFTRAININLIGTFNMLRLAAAAMSSNEPDHGGERGVIINTASISAYEGQIGQAAYSASKAGVIGLTLPAARELARDGIRVMTIAPGIFDTPMMAGFPQAVQRSLAQTVPFPPRLGQPEEYAQLVASILEQPMLNGETIRLDGALRMAPR